MDCLAIESQFAYNLPMANPASPIDFASLCKAIRQHRKLKLKDMAELLGVTLESYQRYESGIRQPNGQQAYILAQMEAQMLADIEKQSK